MSRSDITDWQLAHLLNMSFKGLRIALGRKAKRRRGVGHPTNLLDAKPLGSGDGRRWPVEGIARVLGLSVAEIESAIGDMDADGAPEEDCRKRPRGSRWGEPEIVYPVGGALAPS